ncbi:MAG: hypothetical protein Q7Q73_16610 [Verrucomicrobiota bacterium JB024]|nr:hypothetical protein [Verrucomicrobiota bacterium JB024]
MTTPYIKSLLLGLTLLLPLGYAQAANDNAKPDKGKAHMSMNELQAASDEELEATYGGDKAVQIRAILDEMKVHQQAMVELRKQLTQATGQKGGKPDKKAEKSDDKGKDKDKSKDKSKDKNKSKDKDDDSEE